MQAANGGGSGRRQAGAAAQGGGSPARRRKRAGVLQSRRGRHHDDGKRPANTAASSRGSDVSAGRRMTEKRGGGAPTTFLGDTGHEDANERHLRVPHRAAEVLTTSKAADRRRTGRTEAAAGTRFASAGRTGAPRRLGFWRGQAAQRGGGGLYSTRGTRSSGPRAAHRGVRRELREVGSGSGPAPVRLRLEVGDDRRGPPVGDSGRSTAEVGRSWAKSASGLRA
jgi:hypothetical protein